MIFSSFEYIFFFLIIVIFYFFITNKNIKYSIIFLSSSYFYGTWSLKFLFLIYFLIIFNYLIGIVIRLIKNNFFFYFGIFINLFILFYFKYLNFFIENINSFFTLQGLNLDIRTLKIVLPLAISFYTFENISYLVDIRRGFIKPEKNIFFYACFIIFFPKLIAGPVLRAAEFLPQFKKLNMRISYHNLIIGIFRIIFGLFLKVVIADNLASFVDKGFLVNPKAISGLDVLTLSFMFGFQIYFDFCAYTSIAIGSALIFNIKLNENFDFPYFSISPKEFWKKWHITLSSWIRDYVYLPLSRVKFRHKLLSSKSFDINEYISFEKLNILPLLFTWFLVGFWHGASWNFIFWGLYHFVLLFIYRFFHSNFFLNFFIINPKKLITLIGWLITLPLIMLSWIPFRSQNFEQTINLYKRLFDFNNFFQLNMHPNNYLIIFFVFLLHTGAFILHKIYKIRVQGYYKLIIISAMIFTIMLFLESKNKFIYFQF
jgi:D-alanyl-lipoteichoic acid acyltransferase DltB (MBOAT superfamily)